MFVIRGCFEFLYPGGDAEDSPALTRQDGLEFVTPPESVLGKKTASSHDSTFYSSKDKPLSRPASIQLTPEPESNQSNNSKIYKIQIEIPIPNSKSESSYVSQNKPLVQDKMFGVGRKFSSSPYEFKFTTTECSECSSEHGDSTESDPVFQDHFYRHRQDHKHNQVFQPEWEESPDQSRSICVRRLYPGDENSHYTPAQNCQNTFPPIVWNLQDSALWTKVGVQGGNVQELVEDKSASDISLILAGMTSSSCANQNTNTGRESDSCPNQNANTGRESSLHRNIVTRSQITDLQPASGSAESPTTPGSTQSHTLTPEPSKITQGIRSRRHRTRAVNVDVVHSMRKPGSQASLQSSSALTGTSRSSGSEVAMRKARKEMQWKWRRTLMAHRSGAARSSTSNNPERNRAASTTSDMTKTSNKTSSLPSSLIMDTLSSGSGSAQTKARKEAAWKWRRFLVAERRLQVAKRRFINAKNSIVSQNDSSQSDAHASDGSSNTHYPPTSSSANTVQRSASDIESFWLKRVRKKNFKKPCSTEQSTTPSYNRYMRSTRSSTSELYGFPW